MGRLVLIAALLLVCLCDSDGCAADEPASRSTTLDNIRIHYQSHGQGDTAVVFVHGWTCDHTFWRGQMEGLKGKCRMLLIDLPGHGQSDKPKVAYTMDLFAQAVDAVLKDAGVESAVLVGHSMGTPVIRQFYRHYPKKTKALVAVDGSLRPFVTNQADIDLFVDRFAGAEGTKNRTEMIESMFVDATTPELRRHIKERMLSTPEHVAVGAMKGMFDLAVWKEDPIGVPLQSILARSAFWSPDYERFVRKLAPNAEQHALEGVGHFLMMEKPKEVNALLIEFLKKHGAVKE
jgi:pimeloyl-ACP methyl ester carboxylesterase